MTIMPNTDYRTFFKFEFCDQFGVNNISCSPIAPMFVPKLLEMVLKRMIPS
jgi:hypothetical protein